VPVPSAYAANRSSGVRYEPTPAATRSRSTQSSYASRSSSDPYAPRLISVTDRVVSPATSTPRTAAVSSNAAVER
jgi:hypothetical protein